MEKARLPISDYVNDTRTVMDNVPRLLAAMLFIASREVKVEGSFEVVCQLFRAKQLIASRTILGGDPLLQLPGITSKSLDKLRNDMNDETNLLQTLQSMPKGKAEKLLKKVVSNSQLVPSTLASLYAIPRLVIKEVKVFRKWDKANMKNQGVLKLEVEITRERKRTGGQNAESPVTLGIVLGSSTQRLLLGHSEIGISRNGKLSIQKEIEFDWDTARGDSGEDSNGWVILRLLFDSIKGVDSQMILKML